MSRTEEFEELRPLLFAIAQKLLDSAAEAEDTVQEAWLRYDLTPTRPRSPRAFLSTVVTRISIDILRSARVRRERYVGDRLPEPMLSDPYQDPARSAELDDSISTAAALLLERLSALERAVFVLREVFAYDIADIAAALGRSEAACRQLLVRARRHLRSDRPRFAANRQARDEFAARFVSALRHGDVDALKGMLAADVGPVRDAGDILSERAATHTTSAASQSSKVVGATSASGPGSRTSPAIDWSNTPVCHVGTRRTVLP